MTERIRRGIGKRKNLTVCSVPSKPKRAAGRIKGPCIAVRKGKRERGRKKREKRSPVVLNPEEKKEGKKNYLCLTKRAQFQEATPSFERGT